MSAKSKTVKSDDAAKRVQWIADHAPEILAMQLVIDKAIVDDLAAQAALTEAKASAKQTEAALWQAYAELKQVGTWDPQGTLTFSEQEKP